MSFKIDDWAEWELKPFGVTFFIGKNIDENGMPGYPHRFYKVNDKNVATSEANAHVLRVQAHHSFCARQGISPCNCQRCQYYDKISNRETGPAYDAGEIGSWK